VKLAEWARVNRVHTQTAHRWFRQDRMPVPARRLASGTIWVDAAPVGESGWVGCLRAGVLARSISRSGPAGEPGRVHGGSGM